MDVLTNPYFLGCLLVLLVLLRLGNAIRDMCWEDDAKRERIKVDRRLKTDIDV